MPPATDTETPVVPAKPSERVQRVFGWYIASRLMPKRFEAVRLARGTRGHLESLADHPGPVVVCLNHSSWWDPIVAALLAVRLVKGRTPCGPIDREVLANVPIMGKLGLFGVDPEDASALAPMVEHVAGLFRSMPRPTLWITPQGNFRDTREPVRIRPGVSAVCARAGADGLDTRVLSASVEYGFWDAQLPEVFIRLAPVETPADPSSTTGWHRSITRSMRTNAAELDPMVRARDPGDFENLIGSGAGGGPGTHPVYELWLRLTGRSSRVIATRLEQMDSNAAARGNGP